jgi:hypothetical protein
LEFLDLYANHLNTMHSQLGSYLKIAQEKSEENRIRDILGMLRGIELAIDALRIITESKQEVQAELRAMNMSNETKCSS